MTEERWVRFPTTPEINPRRTMAVYKQKYFVCDRSSILRGEVLYAGVSGSIPALSLVAHCAYIFNS